MRRVALVAVVVSALALAPGRVARAQGAAGPQAECRAVGLFLFDVATRKITAVPSRIEVTFPKATDTAREVCFAWMMVGGDRNDKFEQLRLKSFEDAKGKGGKPLFKARKLHGATSSLISLEFDDTPDFDPDRDGVPQDVVESYDLEARFKGQTVLFDPDIVIKRDG